MRAGALVLSLAALVIPLRAFAFVYTVNDATDAADADTTDGICRTTGGTCTLRAAIQQADAWTGSHLVIVPAGTYTLTIAGRGENAAATGDLDITGNLTIRGAGAGATVIDGGAIDRIFDITQSDAVADIAGVTLRNGFAFPSASPSDDGTGGAIRNTGTLRLSDSVVSGNTSSPIGGYAGGGIYHSASSVADVTLALTRVTLSGNFADNHTIQGASFPPSGGGLAILGGAVQILNSVVTANKACFPPPANPSDPLCGDSSNTTILNRADGGGISINSGAVTIADSTISGNVADNHGGGIANAGNGGTGAALTINRSTVSGNTAYLGGGIYDEGSPSRTMTLIDSTVSGNSTQLPNGLTQPPSGGGLFISQPANLLSSTIANNSATQGGGIYIDPAGAPSINAGSATLKNLILYNTPSDDCAGATANITSNGNNIAGDGTCGLGGGDLPATNPQLAALAANQGGPTAVHVPQAGSPAINAGDNANCPTTDQRGFPRVGICDIGSVEFTSGTQADLAVTLFASPSPVAVNAALAYTIDTVNQGPNDATGAHLAFTLPAGASFQSAPGCTQAGGVVSCDFDVAAGATVTRTVTVTATAVGTLTALATATATQNDPNPANNTGIQLAVPSYAPTDVTITTTAKSSGIVIPVGGAELPAGTEHDVHDGDTVIAGQPLIYTLTVGANPNTASNVSVVDTLPAGVSLVSVTPSAGTCSVASQVVTCVLGNLAAGSPATIDLTVMPTVKGTAKNEARGNFDGTFLTAPPLSDFTVNIETRADLEVGMVASSDPVVVGADLGYVVSLTNHGPSDSTNAALTVTLDPSVTYRSASAGGWSCTATGSTIKCTLGTFAADDTSTITLFVTPTAIGTITAAAALGGDDTDPDTANNNVTVTTTVVSGTVNAPDISVSLDATPNPATVGSDLSFRATIVNNSTTNDAHGVTLTETLPANTSFRSASAGCSRNGGFVQCNVGSLAHGTSALVTVVVRPTAKGDMVTSVTALDGSGQDSNLDNNTSTITVTANGATSSGLHKGHGCFIATAAYGSYLDPHVMVLRRFRDHYLLTNAPGRAFVAFYYEYSPPLADFIAGHESLRMLTRWALTPLVLSVEYPAAPPAVLAALGLVLALRRRRRDETPSG